MNDNFENNITPEKSDNENKSVTFEPMSDFETIENSKENLPEKNYFEVSEETPLVKETLLNPESDAKEKVSFPESSPSVGENFAEKAPSAVHSSEQRAFSYEWNGSVTPNTPSVQYQPPVRHKETHDKKSTGAKTPVALLLAITILVSMIFGAGSAFVTYNLLESRNSGNDSEDNNASKGQSYTDKLGKDVLSTIEITEYCAPSVVEIFTESVQTGIFSQQYIESGAGSGVIIEKDGYVVTNHHVIDGAARVSVTLRTGESYQAQVVGSDRRMDLAVLKFEPDTELTVAVFGDSDELVVGEKTVAIGNPLGQLGGTVTEGIVSALDREMVVDGQKMNLLQTDTAINPGNSGGGLFNERGELVGIVSAKSTGSEIEGLGFAIPINDVLDVISDIKEHGYVKGRIDLGMELIDINSLELMFIYGTYDFGCSIYSVYEGSNAERAGFREYDIITAVNGESVESAEDVEYIINEMKVGDEVTFTVMRGRGEIDLTMELEEYVPKNFNNQEDDNALVIPERFG